MDLIEPVLQLNCNQSIDPILDTVPPSDKVVQDLQPTILGKCTLANQHILIILENSRFSQVLLSTFFSDRKILLLFLRSFFDIFVNQ